MSPLLVSTRLESIQYLIFAKSLPFIHSAHKTHIVDPRIPRYPKSIDGAKDLEGLGQRSAIERQPSDFSRVLHRPFLFIFESKLGRHRVLFAYAFNAQHLMAYKARRRATV
jgi:hypothetical protein